MGVFSHALSTNRYGEADLIVDTDPSRGTHVTLTSAMAAAVSGQTIFLRTSVTENVTITPGVNISAWTGSSLNVPSITGTLTMTGAGTSTISGVRLVTNSAFAIAVTGSAASILNVNNCYLNCSNNTGISFTSSSGSAAINVLYCQGNLGTTGIAYFASSSAGTLIFSHCDLYNTGASLTASTASAGTIGVQHSFFYNPITTSGTATLGSVHNSYASVANTTILTIGGSGNGASDYDSIASGTATAVTVTSSFTIRNAILTSSNATVAGGAGAIVLGATTIMGTGLVAPTTMTGAAYHQTYGYRSTTQPAFFAYLASTATNKTGNGTVYTLGTDALTEVFDQQSNFVTSGTFTAPVTGRYMIGSTIVITGCTIATGALLALTTSNRTINFDIQRPAGTSFLSPVNSVLSDLDAADTFTVVISSSGEAGDTDDIFGSTPVLETIMWGYLVC